MSTDHRPKLPKMPVGVDDTTGVPVVGSTLYPILDCAITIHHEQIGDLKRIHDMGFKRGPYGSPNVAYGLAATWACSSKTLIFLQLQTEDLYAKLEVQAAKIAKLERRLNQDKN